MEWQLIQWANLSPAEATRDNWTFSLSLSPSLTICLLHSSCPEVQFPKSQVMIIKGD